MFFSHTDNDLGRSSYGAYYVKMSFEHGFSQLRSGYGKVNGHRYVSIRHFYGTDRLVYGAVFRVVFLRISKELITPMWKES